MYKISRCKEVEINDLMLFIDKHWKKNHILSKNEALLRWQHFNEKKGDLNFYIARNQDTNELDGVLGVIPVSHFDAALECNKDYWTALWKVRDDIPVQPGLGHSLSVAFEREAQFNSHGVFGITNVAQQYYKLRKYTVLPIRHFYFLNPECSETFIASGIEHSEPVKPTGFTISEIFNLNGIDIMPVNQAPIKSITYFINRYQLHPFYKYRFFVVSDSFGKGRYILVLRKIEAEKRFCLRIVDIVGEICDENIVEPLRGLLVNENAEYIDCLNSGIDGTVWEKLGFRESTSSDRSILPNYFEPFVNRKDVIYYGFKSTGKSYRVFKGDSDQDRPNII